MTDISFKSATALAADVKTKKIGCSDLLEHFWSRVERFNLAINAVVVEDMNRARAKAREADIAIARSASWGPLHGVPITVKESFDVAGTPTTWGIPALEKNYPVANAIAVDRLMSAGAIVFGKTNVPTLLADWQTYNPLYGTTNNPWQPTLSPGGSSGGSAAALAAGLTGGASEFPPSRWNDSFSFLMDLAGLHFNAKRTGCHDDPSGIKLFLG